MLLCLLALLGGTLAVHQTISPTSLHTSPTGYELLTYGDSASTPPAVSSAAWKPTLPAPDKRVIRPLNGTTHVFVSVYGVLILNSSLSQHRSASNSSRYRWLKHGDHQNQTKMELLTNRGNCTYRVEYGDRIQQCGQVFSLYVIYPSDSGLYAVRYLYNKTYAEEQLFQVHVFEQTPVLIPIMVDRQDVWLGCEDLTSRKSAKMTLEYTNVFGDPIFKHHHHTAIISINTYKKQTGFSLQVRCCSVVHHSTACSTWSSVIHTLKLSTKETGFRSWCRAESKRYPRLQKRSFIARTPKNDFDFDPDLPYRPMGAKCERTVFLAKALFPGERVHHMQMCANVSSVIVGFCGKVIKYHQLGQGKTVLAQNVTRYPIFHPKPGDSGRYAVNETEKITQFILTVLPKPQVELSLISMGKSHLMLQCKHTMSQKAVISWDLHGIFDHVAIDARAGTITIYPDCWKNWTYWYFRFRVRCVVTFKPWVTVSHWFMGEAQKY